MLKKYGADGGYIYTLALINSTKKASPALGQPNSAPVKSAGNAFNRTIPQNPPVVNNEDYINSGSKAVMTKNRIDYLIEDSGAGIRKDYAQAWITSISPTDFSKIIKKEVSADEKT